MKHRRSIQKLKLLCGFTLVTASAPGGTQESNDGSPADAFAPETGALDAALERDLDAALERDFETALERDFETALERDFEAQELESATQVDPQATRLTAADLDAETLDEEALATGEAALNLVARLEAEILLSDLVDQERWEAAIPVAQRMVELTEEELGISLELGVALSNLAILQRRLELYEPSEENFVRSIDVIREADGTYSDAVINPLIGLGVNYQLRGAPNQAATIFEEARTVSRRVHGLMNEQQIDILDHLSNTMRGMERYGAADRYQLTALQLRERIYGTDTMEILPALYKFARWLRSAYRFQEERDQYTRAMTIIRDNVSESSLEIVFPLRAIGNSFRIQKYAEGRGIGALRRALEITQAQEQPDRLTIAGILVDIGDWSVAFSKVGPTGDEYRQAWELLGDLENGDDLRAAWFDDPTYVLRENPSNRGIGSATDPGVVPGHVLVTFDVLESGRTTNVTVVESVPPGLKDDSTARAITRSRFRPRMIDGVLVSTQGLARNFTFHYLPRD